MEAGRQRILTTHAGSLPRPADLVALHVARSRGEPVDPGELEAAVEAAARDVISRQIGAGLDVVNDGEMGRESFFTYVQHRMSGFGGRSERPTMADLLRYPSYLEQLLRRGAGPSVNLLSAPRAQGEVRYGSDGAVRAECARVARLLKAHAGSYTEAFVTAPSPGIIAAAMQNDFYPDLESYVEALARALATEYRAIHEAGFLLQIDAPDLAMERHTLFQGRPLPEFLAFVRTVVGALNRALAGIPRERVRLHVCWGNYEGPHDCDVPLAEIWDSVAEARVGGFLLSLANPRHAHEYRVFEATPLADGVVLIPGVIDSTTNYVEHPEVVALRIERIARVVGDPARIVAGTDCGFETSAGFTAVAPEIVWAKLAALAEGAALATQRLWGSAA